MNEDPLMILLYAAAAIAVGYLYRNDFRQWKSGAPNPKAMPGATGCSLVSLVVACAGALALLALETGGEIALGVASEQSDVVAYLLIAWIAAGLIEEVVFRGFLVVTSKGKAALVASCIGFSLLFAVIHPHIWSYEEGVLGFHFTTKALFSTGILFANSLWFYYARFASWNPHRSLFPCMLAHSVSNLGVFIVKLAQGHVTF